MVRQPVHVRADDKQSTEQIPPLEPGDRLTRDEFERRYEAMPRGVKAELLEGLVHMPSPTRFHHHGRPHSHLITWLGYYESGTPGVVTGDNSTTRLDMDNESQPDAVLLIDPACGGQARISADDYIEHAPEFIAEVAASSVSIDLHTKFRVYQRSGVREYLVWRVLDQAIDWFVLRAGQYERLMPDTQGVLRSEVFPGLWLDTAALLRGDIAAVLATVQQGLTSPEHEAFVARLRPSSL
jgi:hypothetical protein